MCTSPANTTASGPLAFDLQGWIAHEGEDAYKGTLERFTGLVQACECADRNSLIKADAP
jgi:hypothetical protein